MSSKDQLADLELAIRRLTQRADALLYHLPGQHDQQKHAGKGSEFSTYKKFPGTKYDSPKAEKRLQLALKGVATLQGDGKLKKLVRFMSKKKNNPTSQHTFAVGVQVLKERQKNRPKGPLRRAIKGVLGSGARLALGFEQEELDSDLRFIADAILAGELEKVENFLRKE